MLHYFNPLAWFRWVGQFLAAWAVSIRWQGSVAAIPALIVLVLMVGGVTLAWSQSKDWRFRIVDRRLGEALKQEDHDAAELLLDRRLRDEPENQRLRLVLASTKANRGEDEEAHSMFESLALNDRNADAARWLLEKKFDLSERNEWEPDKIALYGRLTEICVEDRPDDLAARARRADYFLLEDKIPEAIPHVEFLVQKQPLRGLDLARLYQAINDEESAAAAARRAESHLADLVLERPTNSALRVAHAKALIFQKDFRRAMRTLSSGYQRNQDPQLRPVMAQTLIMWSESLQQNYESPEALQESLRLINEASRLAPSDPLVMSAISKVIMRTLENDDQQIRALQKSLLEEAQPGIVHFLKGTSAMLAGRSEVAASELELAYRQLPQSPAILNNLAMAKLQEYEREPSEKSLGDADKLVGAAIEIGQRDQRYQSQLPFFLETRGQLRQLQGKYLDAISDYERVLPVPALKLTAHRKLASAYAAIGNQESSTAHAELAKQLEEEQAREKEAQRDALEVYEERLRQREQGEKANDSESRTNESTPPKEPLESNEQTSAVLSSGRE